MYVHHPTRTPRPRGTCAAILTAVFLLAAAALLLSGCPMPEGEPPGDTATDSTAPDPDPDDGTDTDPEPDPPVLSPGETTTLETGPVRIEVTDIYWLELQDYYVPLDRSVAIDIRITNLTDSRVDYSGMYSWGVMISSEGEQIETTEWIGAANAQYFNGTGIAAGAFIRDTISFDELPTDSNPDRFEVKAEPPIDGTEAFEIHFDVGEVGEKAPTSSGKVDAVSGA
ncbi:MAG: hypothetical protein ACLFO1_07120 [Spirochaetaceae bacterium]